MKRGAPWLRQRSHIWSTPAKTLPSNFVPVHDELMTLQRRRLNVLENNSSAETGSRPEDYQQWRELSRQVGAIQRATVLHFEMRTKLTTKSCENSNANSI